MFSRIDKVSEYFGEACSSWNYL